MYATWKIIVVLEIVANEDFPCPMNTKTMRFSFDQYNDIHSMDYHWNRIGSLTSFDQDFLHEMLEYSNQWDY